MFNIPDCLPNQYQDCMDYNFSDRTGGFNLRDKYRRDGMFAFVSWKWINPFVEWINNRRCLEVMSGRGILSYALKQKGIKIITTDDYSWFDMEGMSKWHDTLVEVEKLDAVDAVIKYGKDIDILIISWPYMDNIAYQVIKELYNINPEVQVVYIGEGRGGCTADDEFYENFKEVKDEKFEIVVNNYERWWGITRSSPIG